MGQSEDINIIFNNSLSRCVADPDFLNVFYDHFLQSSNDIRQKFKDTDFKHQKQMMEQSLFAIVAASESNSSSDNFMTKIAQRHNQLKIKAEHYKIWLECLLMAVRQCDAYFDITVENAWKQILGRGIDRMKID